MSVRLIRPIAIALAVTVLASCGGDDENGSQTTTTTTRSGEGQLSALFAGYDVAVGANPRVIVGLIGPDNQLVTFGTARFEFRYHGADANSTSTPPTAGPTADATWIPIPGQNLETIAGDGPPRLVNPSEGTGVYAATDVTFSSAGFWEVEVTVELDGQARTATAAFEVATEHQVLAPGDRAPTSDNPLPGAAGVTPQAIDSRADDDGTVPDPELHTTTVADALTTARPTMVVVSTPVFCQSQFCGPITDAIQALAGEFGDRVNFIHLEVWEDFEAERLNTAAAEWIVPTGGGGNEPWVFLVDADGVITDRWDNVASEPELRAALTEGVGGS